MATSSPSGSGPSLVRWWPLGAAAVVAAALAGIGWLPRWPGLVNAVALPPLDLAFDLRVLVARAPSYPLFALGVALSLAVRASVLAAILAAVGPPQPFGTRLRRAGAFYAVALVPMAVAGSLQFAGVAALYAWYWWAGLAVAAVTALLMAPRVVGGRRLVVASYLMVLGALGAAAEVAGEGWTLVLVGISALVTGLTLARMAPPAPPVRRGARAALAALVLMVGMPGAAAGPWVAPDAVLFLVPGVDTSSGRGAMYLFATASIGFPCDRVFYYSYRGPGRGAPIGQAPCPIRVHARYANSDTQRPLDVLVDAFSRQVEAIHEARPDVPIVVITHSQGAVIAWRALTQQGNMGVSHMISLAGFPRGVAAYPPPEKDGAGRIGSDALRLLSALFRRFGSATFDPDAPLAREILARPDGLQDVFGRRLPPGVTAATVFTTLDLATAPEGYRAPEALDAGIVNTTHSAVTTSDEAAEAVRRFLTGRPLLGDSMLATILRPVLPALGPPPLGA